MDSKQQQLKVFRRHLLITGASATLAFGMVIALSLFLPLMTQFNRGELDSANAAVMAEYFLFLHGAFWPVLLCALAGSVATAMLLYRRMTGPLAQFIRSYDVIARGEVPDPITIRKHDYLGLESEALNRMIAALRVRSGERAEGISAIAEIADELAESGENADTIARLRDSLKTVR
jgi:methyl-accepting chemotaxis protein